MVTQYDASHLRLCMALERAGSSTFRAMCVMLVVRRLPDSNEYIVRLYLTRELPALESLPFIFSLAVFSWLPFKMASHYQAQCIIVHAKQIDSGTRPTRRSFSMVLEAAQLTNH